MFCVIDVSERSSQGTHKIYHKVIYAADMTVQSSPVLHDEAFTLMVACVNLFCNNHNSRTLKLYLNQGQLQTADMDSTRRGCHLCTECRDPGRADPSEGTACNPDRQPDSCNKRMTQRKGRFPWRVLLARILSAIRCFCKNHCSINIHISVYAQITTDYLHR